MAAGDHHSVEPLNPPIILLLAFFAQRHLPLRAHLLHEFHTRAVRDEVLVAVALHQALDVPPEHRPRPERRIGAVHADGPVAPDLRDGLLAELHSEAVDVGLQVGVDRRLGKARLVRLWREGRQPLRDGHRRIGRAVSQTRKVGERRRRRRVADPASPSATASNSGRRAGATLPASSGCLAPLEDADEVECLFLRERIDRDCARGPGPNYRHPFGRHCGSGGANSLRFGGRLNAPEKLPGH